MYSSFVSVIFLARKHRRLAGALARTKKKQYKYFKLKSFLLYELLKSMKNLQHLKQLVATLG